MSVRIAIAEDQRLVRELLAGLLVREADFEVVGQASTVREAIALAASARPDILLLDVTLPDVEGMEAMQPLLYALAGKHWSLVRQKSAPQASLELGRLVQEAAANFGRTVLTPRERDVVTLILRGYSTKSISQALGISPGTVKVHRENIYGKLGISSQAELFNLFIASVSVTEGGAGADAGRAA